MIIKDVIGVPNFEVHEFSTKKTKYALCIPILNENGRIQIQLKRAKINKIDQLVDIIICDGDSNDGCNDIEMLKSYGVNSLLIKKDTGKYSAQLRMGLWWCLNRGYEGIITIDGNNKDSIESISLFTRKLDEGYDFIQGSRFIEGGEDINTPLIRKLAIKFIHAPVISFVSGFKYTDTTNGFRAYSKNYLLHPYVQPFRDVFQTYELLAYLSVIAPKIGLKVCEVPVKREYPKKGKIPTKISFFKGNIRLLRILFSILKGDYYVK